MRASHQPGEIQFHDRCAVCTAALAVYLGYPLSPFLAGELERVRNDAIYQRRVFLIGNLGFVTPTATTRITFEETVRFEKDSPEDVPWLWFSSWCMSSPEAWRTA